MSSSSILFMNRCEWNTDRRKNATHIGHSARNRIEDTEQRKDTNTKVAVSKPRIALGWWHNLCHHQNHRCFPRHVSHADHLVQHPLFLRGQNDEAASCANLQWWATLVAWIRSAQNAPLNVWALGQRKDQHNCQLIFWRRKALKTRNVSKNNNNSVK